jgi:predicted neuraminidase
MTANPFESDVGVQDLSNALAWGRLIRVPLMPGVWSLLEPAGLQNHAPQLCWLDADRLGCVWMAGDREGTAGMSVYASELVTGSGQWSSPRLLSEDPQRSEQNPLFFVTENPRQLQLIHTAQRVRKPGESVINTSSAFSMQWTAMLRWRSLNLAADTWGESVDLLVTTAFCRHPPLRRIDGNWLLPIYRSLEEGGAFGHDHSLVQLLNPNGRPCGEAVAVPDSTGRVQGSIVPSADGQSLLQFFRSRLADRVYRSVADLDGLHWSAPEPTVLPNNNSSIQALRLASGRLALIFNRFGLDPGHARGKQWGEANWPRTRWPLSVALSEDDGLSWPWIRDIDHGEGFCGEANWVANGQLAYPCILEGQPGDLHLAYSWGNRAAIRYWLLREEDILGVAPAT